jgi:hypothetical protein
MSYFLRLFNDAFSISRYYYHIFQEVLRKNMKTNKSSQCHNRDFNRTPHKYKSGALLLVRPVRYPLVIR